MLSSFVSGGVPAHGVGFQSHFTPVPNANSLRANFPRFPDLGPDWHITELGIRVPVIADGFASAADLTAQCGSYLDRLGAALGCRGSRAPPRDGSIAKRKILPARQVGRFAQCVGRITRRTACVTIGNHGVRVNTSGPLPPLLDSAPKNGAFKMSPHDSPPPVRLPDGTIHLVRELVPAVRRRVKRSGPPAHLHPARPCARPALPAAQWICRASFGRLPRRSRCGSSFGGSPPTLRMRNHPPAPHSECGSFWPIPWKRAASARCSRRSRPRSNTGFIHRWYGECATKGKNGMTADDDAQCIPSLVAALDNPHLAEIASNPMHLTAMACFHTARAGQPLPEESAKLYEQLVDTLLFLWDKTKKAKGEEQIDELAALLNDAKCDEKRLRSTLDRLAFAAQRGDGEGFDGLQKRAVVCPL